MNQIPNFFNPSKLTILSTREFQNNGTVSEMTVKDPEGDQLVISQWVEDTGVTAQVPDTKLQFRFTPDGGDGSLEAVPSKDEMVKLSYGLTDAQEAQNLNDDGFGMPTPVGSGEPNPIDSFLVSNLIYEVSNLGGVIRAF